MTTRDSGKNVYKGSKEGIGYMAKFKTVVIDDSPTKVHVVRKTESGFYVCETCHNAFSEEELKRTHEVA
jgi:hypothetical protein